MVIHFTDIEVWKKQTYVSQKIFQVDRHLECFQKHYPY